MVELHDGPALARFALCGDGTVAAAAGAAFGVVLPMQPCRAAQAGGRAALWLGPNESLLLAPRADLAAVADGLARALDGLAHSLVEVSDGTVTLLVQGEQADLALRAGCPLDLHPRAFPVGMATRTVLSRIGVVLWRRDATAWHLEVAPSLAAYARNFLGEAARGFPTG